MSTTMGGVSTPSVNNGVFGMSDPAMRSLYANIGIFNAAVNEAVASGGQQVAPNSQVANATRFLMEQQAALAQNYFGANDAQLTPQAYNTVVASRYQLNQALTTINQGGNALPTLQQLGRNLEAAFRPAEPLGGTGGGTGGAGGVTSSLLPQGSLSVNTQVQQLLAQARGASTTADKASLVSSAIATLMSMLNGAGGGAGTTAPQPPVTTQPQSPAPGGTTAPQPPTMPAPQPPAPPPAPVITERSFDPNTLSSMLTANGRGVSYIGGSFGVSGGKEKDEIDRDEQLTFTAPPASAGKTIAGARVDIAKLFGDERGGQERGSIEVWKDGKLIDTVNINGSINGSQSVDINKAFDKLVFKTAGGNSDYAIRNIVLKESGPAAGGAGGAGSVAPGGVPNELSNSLSEFRALAQSALAVLNSLAQLARRTNASPATLDQINTAVAGVNSAVMQMNGAATNPAEVNALVQAGLRNLASSIGSVVSQLAPSLPDTAEARATMDQVASLIASLSAALTRGN